jgi:hypothetical protein
MVAPTLIVFLGGFGSSDAERLVDDARLAATLDSIDAWRSLPGAPPAILVTDQNIDAPNGVTVDRDDGEFHFGRRLAEVLRKHDVRSAVYMGGGSLPLFEAQDFEGVQARLSDGVAVTNNLFSSDLVAFPVNDAVLAAIEPVARDNSLARALQDSGGLRIDALERSLATQFDIDTPTDVAVLAITGGGGPRLSETLAEMQLDARYRAVLPLFLDQTKELIVAGRVGSHAWSYLERETACRVRLFAEERGMEADGRGESGEARSLLAYHLDAVGLPRFFETLAELGDAAFIDTRVLLAHKRIETSREDRFLSDLGRWQDIGEPFLREFTRAAVEAAVPVLLGGHSLMSGGLMALNEFAWAERDAGRL